jgi:photosystem II stability/assembly factor-like uncharacterized protein
MSVALLLVSCTSSATPGANSSIGLSVPSTALPSPTIGQAPTAPPSSQPAASAAPTPIPLPSFADVAAAGNGVVWTLVAGSHLFRSLDFGTTWQERAAPTLPQITKISFVDDRNGWTLTTGSPATGCMAQYFAVWQTTDAAQTWQKAYESEFASSRGCKSALAFVDTLHGFVTVAGRDVAPQILRSMDGGATWASSERLPDPPGFRFEPSVSTLTPGAVADFGAVLLVSALAQASPDVRRHVYRSTDRGATWSYVVAAPMSSDIVFLTPTRWLQIVPNSSSETTDAGASWHAFATDYGQAAGVAPQIAFGDARTGYATVRGGIQRTTDGGVHWIGLATPGTSATR